MKRLNVQDYVEGPRCLKMARKFMKELCLSDEQAMSTFRPWSYLFDNTLLLLKKAFCWLGISSSLGRFAVLFLVCGVQYPVSVNLNTIDSEHHVTYIHLHSENSNVFVVYSYIYQGP